MTDSSLFQSGRRAFITRTLGGVVSYSALGALTGCASSTNTAQDSAPSAEDAWAMAEQIRANVKAPQFPDRTFDIRDFGAKADGKTDNSAAFTASIAACHKAGGGKVLVTQGRYLSGPIHLLSNVNLHITKDATIAFSTDPKAYLPAVLTRWEGMEIMGYSPLIYAYEQTNIAITGAGTLDGQANRTTWWPWKGSNFSSVDWGVPGVPTQTEARNKLMQDMENNVPVAQRQYAEGSYLRPVFLQPYLCTNVLIEGITINNAPFWLLNPVRCDNVTIDGVTFASMGPNSDGCDPESCKNVVIKNCFFETGDDCIAIKSGRNADGRRINIPSENILISNCKMRHGHGGVVIGSEISGGVRNVFVENCEMSSPELERGIRIKTNSVRGGLIENFYLRDITIGEVQTAIVIDFDYEEGDAGKFTPTVRNIDIRNLVCQQAQQVFQVRGYERSPIQNLHLNNCHFKEATKIGILEKLDNFVADKVTIKGVEFKV
ncbi:glycoside hydrolase family 28 protein [Cellvibrio sp. NN19]|uniref:glycoside hydrolase family 28 protein n=1 Tax=Cellvibrio chitinivorans TaxID=3102792 RepID=UPI002B4130FB|nr:glycoside hydrolase family 28 protein [Cellvibrio sp. NN19]